MKKYALALDLKDDPQLIEEYKTHHKKVWPEIEASIVDSGILNMEIYLVGNRMFMIIEADDNFSFDKKAQMDEANPKVVEWETLMWRYQQALPMAKPGEKWKLMDRVYHITK
jgi:L-rhamnose mutarotase